MRLEKQVKPGPDSLVGTNVAWSKLVLLKVGFDATADDANRWLPWAPGEPGAPNITEKHLADAREQLQATDKRKKFLLKGDLVARVLEDYLKTPAGQESIRQFLGSRKAPREKIHTPKKGQ